MKFIIKFITILFLFNQLVFADNLLCVPKPIASKIPLPIDGSSYKAFANVFIQKNADIFLLEDDVTLQQPGLVMQANKIIINRLQNIANAFGQVELHSKDFIVLGKSASLDQQNFTTSVQQPTFQNTQTRAHGSAQHLFSNRQLWYTTLENVAFSTCIIENNSPALGSTPGLTPKDVDWLLSSKHLTIDEAKQRIYARNTVVYFHSLPIFYTPYLSFPTTQRATGLLMPTFGGNKSITQTSLENFVSLPLYFNIAPELDNTLTFTKMQDRGILLGNEFRYLQPNHSGVFTVNFIEDAVASRADGLNDPNNLNIAPINKRWDMVLHARQRWSDNITSVVNWRNFSDRYFYADLPVNASLLNRTSVRRNVAVNFNANNLNAYIKVADFLRLQNNFGFSYAKKPSIGVNYYHDFKKESLNNLSFNLTTKATQFVIPQTGHAMPEALRTVVSPSIKYNIIKPYGNFKAKVIANKVNYQMHNNGFNNTGNTSHTINVPQFVLAGGLVFTRDFKINNNNFSQTLEPQIQYLYAPFQNQSHIPLFDTGRSSLSFNNLFAYNRFSGFDRIADSKQVSLALTTKLLNPVGRILAQAGLGQIHYLKDQRVQLHGNNIVTDRVSDYFAKVGLNTNRLSINSTAMFSKENYALINANSRLKIDLSPQFIFLLTSTIKNYNRIGEQENMAVGFNWQITNDWSVASYASYDFTANRKNEHSGSLRYDSCCWASEISVKETKMANGLYNYHFQFLIELKGLSTVGTPFKQYLTERLNF